MAGIRKIKRRALAHMLPKLLYSVGVDVQSNVIEIGVFGKRRMATLRLSVTKAQALVDLVNETVATCRRIQ